ncbi:MAG: PPC domain-containing DNA-binding protein, partial [Rhodoplanes sp.]
MKEDFFIRLDQGDELIYSLKAFAQLYEIDFYAIISGVGMIEGLRLGFFCANDNDYDVHTISGLLDLSSVSGNLAIR